MKLIEYVYSLEVMFDYNEKDQKTVSAEERAEYEDAYRETYNYAPFADDEEDELGKLYVECLNKYIEKHPNKLEMEKTLQLDFSKEEINAYVEKYASAQKEGKSFYERFHGWDATFILLIPWCIGKVLRDRNRFEGYDIFQVNVEINGYILLWYDRLGVNPGFWIMGNFPKYEIKDGLGLIPEGTTKIEDRAFLECEELQCIRIPESVIEIGYRAFEECTALKTVTFPAGVKKINDKFIGCTAMETIYVPAKRTDYYKKRLPAELHSLIVELPPEKKAKK